MKQYITAAAAIIIVAAVAIAASRNNMGSMHHHPAASQSAQPVATTAVTINAYAFSPMVITVKAGATVTWTNQDTVRHTVTSDQGSNLNSPLFARGQTYTHTFTTPGTYTYHCQPHPFMHGTVIVTP